jgi:hypothetical protein
MISKRTIYGVVAAAAVVAAIGAGVSAQDQLPDLELMAMARMFPDVGPGLRAIHRDPRGRYYVLTHNAPAVYVYNAKEKKLGQIPAQPSKDTALIAGADFDLGTNGYLYVADQGANQLKIYDDDGRLAQSIAVTDPESVAALPDGKVAVAGLQSNKLVEVLDRSGVQVSEFGDREPLSTRRELNHSLNAGKLLADPAADLYYAFTYMPEPTVRRYDAAGKPSLEIELRTIEFYPAATSTRRRISENEEEDHHGNLVLRPVINAVGVDPQTLDVWVAMDDELAHFDRNGNRIGATYRTFVEQDEDDVRFVPVSILVEPDRLVMASDPTGVYTFPRPDKAPGVNLTPSTASTPSPSTAPAVSGPPESRTTTPPTIPQSSPQDQPH